MHPGLEVKGLMSSWYDEQYVTQVVYSFYKKSCAIFIFLKYIYCHKFEALDVVDRGSETQLQVAENNLFHISWSSNSILII